ncbi:MAG: response regulator, partial [Parvibaculaceae bacterium]|nr:response regulator [Parvibaculaceae bacterium]
EELQLAKEEAEAASEAKSDFLAMMSHEIRTPLNGVLGTLRVLEQSPLNSDQHSLIRLATSSGETLSLMLSDALDFAKIEAGRLELETVPFRPCLLISDIAEFWRPVVEGKGLDFHVTLQPDMPKVMIGDTGRIRQILNNFLSNAAKFTDIGSIKVELGIDLDTDGVDCFSLSVVDTGQGIAEADKANVFLEFQQLGRHVHERRGGTGLGLAICRKLSEMMEGSVSFQSQPGQGSLFKCVLPLKIGNSEMLPAESESVPESQKQLQTISGKAPNVLVVEDNGTNQIVASRLLINMGCQVDCVDDGRQAIEAVARRNYDVILMDINMPVMGGLEATERLRALPKIGSNLRIIALTAYAMEEDIQSVKAAGMDGFVSKPIVGNQLHRALEAALENTSPQESTPDTPDFTQPVIQREALNELLAEFAPEVQQRLVVSICADVTKAASAIVEGVRQNDLVEVERRSHTLKSVSGTFGAYALQTQVEEINRQCREHKKLPSFQDAHNVLVASQEALQELEQVLRTSQGAVE